MDVYKYKYYECYGDTLSILRKSKGYTKKYIAEMINVSPSTVSNHEFDRTLPELVYVARYCSLYGLELWEFFHLVAFTKEDSVSPLVTSDIRKLALQHMITK